MAEPATSESSPDTDRDFDPSAEQMIHDFDDEHTLEEEEALSNSESVGNELDQLQKEGEMPMEQLLAMYYGEGGPPGPSSAELHDTRSSSEEEILSNQDLTLDKEEIARDLQLKSEEHDKETSFSDLLDSVEMPSHTVRLLRSANSQPASSDDDSEDVDYEPADDWKKTIQVGSDYQTQMPVGMCKYGDAPAYENEDRLLWDPHRLDDAEVEHFLHEVQNESASATTQGVQAIPQGVHARDDEQALYLLSQCGHNVDEALRRRKMQAVPPTDPMSLWSEEECRNFENGLRQYGKDFYHIQQNKVKTRSVGELVQFYYLWKKTERHDVFANKTRLEKKKYALHPGVTDYMDRFLDEQDNPAPPRERSSSPGINSLLYGDPKRHTPELKHANPEELAAALEMVQKVVDTTNVIGFPPLGKLAGGSGGSGAPDLCSSPSKSGGLLHQNDSITTLAIPYTHTSFAPIHSSLVSECYTKTPVNMSLVVTTASLSTSSNARGLLVETSKQLNMDCSQPVAKKLKLEVGDSPCECKNMSEEKCSACRSMNACGSSSGSTADSETSQSSSQNAVPPSESSSDALFSMDNSVMASGDAKPSSASDILGTGITTSVPAGSTWCNSGMPECGNSVVLNNDSLDKVKSSMSAALANMDSTVSGISAVEAVKCLTPKGNAVSPPPSAMATQALAGTIAQ